MWKASVILVFALLVVSSLSADISNSSPNVGNNSLSSQNATTTANSTSSAVESKIVESKTESVVDPKADKGTEDNPFQNSDLTKLSDENSLGSFKYYFAILLVSSLSVISVIIFKALRLRKTRAELKYGKPLDKDEQQPLGRSDNKWLEESSDENEDEIFDINFLKNSRTNNV